MTTLHDEDRWEARVRSTAVNCPTGLSVLDVDPKNILYFSQGTFSLVHSDIVAALPPELVDQVQAVLAQQGVQQAFAMRRELVNYKKCLLNISKQALSIVRTPS